MCSRGKTWTLYWVAGLALATGGPCTLADAPIAPAPPAQPVLTNIAQFHLFAGDGQHGRRSIRIEGVVCWADPCSNRFILADATGAVPVRPGADAPPAFEGQRLRIEGECSAQRSGLGSALVPPLLVDNDRLHDPIEASASIRLEPGLPSIRLRWFNSQGRGLLRVSYEGPGLPRQPIPEAALFHRDASSTPDQPRLLPGLAWQCWEGEWGFLPDFSRLPAAASGVSASFDVERATRIERVGLEFCGHLRIPAAGVYTFWVESDDGAILCVDDSQLRLVRLGQEAPPAPRRLAVGQPLAGPDRFAWSEIEGQVTMVHEDFESLRLELASGEDRLLLEIVDAAGCPADLLLGSRIRAAGICMGIGPPDRPPIAGALQAPTGRQVQLLEIAPGPWRHRPLTPIAELNRATAAVRLRGTVQSVEAGRTILLEDATGRAAIECARSVSGIAGRQVEVIARTDLGAPGQLKEAHLLPLPAPDDAGTPLPTLTTIRQVRSLSQEDADRRYPVRVEGVVTALFGNGPNLVIQDSDQGIYLAIPLSSRHSLLQIGDLCRIHGFTRSGAFAPMISADKVVRLGLGHLPEPVRPALDQILNGSLDSQYVEIEGLVTRIDGQGVRILTRIGSIEIDLGSRTAAEWRRFEECLVRVRGCMLAVYDRVTGLVSSGKIRMIHPSITVDRPAPADPFALEARPVAGLRSFDPQASPFQRTKVSGQIVFARPGLFCLMDGAHGLRFYPKSPATLPPGAHADVVGILDLSGASPALHEAWVRLQDAGPLPSPRTLTETNLLSGAHNATLVRVESSLVNVRRDRGSQVLELRAGPYVHTAHLSTNMGALPPIPIGSQVAVTGVYVGEGGDWAAGRDIERFSIALRSPADLEVLARPSWWTPRRLLAVLAALASVLLIALTWIGVLRRQVEERTRLLAEQIQARQRVEQQRAIERERSRLARDLHDDLGGGLTEISMLGSLASDPGLDPGRKSGFLQQLTERARQLVTTLDAIVWAVNPKYDTVSSLAGYFSLYAQRFLGLASLECRLEISDALPGSPVESTVRHSLFLALKEALNNVVRHARATEVRLRIAVEGGDLIVSVADNGCGLDNAPLAGGMQGLSNMRARMAALGGQCQIHSAPGQGATVSFHLPLPPQPSP
ncbi:MAG TPA: ATP-binding protein [Candidatus Paceibacterota bacterium]|nr:hypothetical protein [Verrucomicrobiota bacterium]HOX00736.1 ATP-binding protein [Verrucomicrobiota bacterium]HRZ45716.1 ATP-binding protein [Candidatus Paceibacterota bacterium]